jgi:hypothetical protein
MTQLRETLVGLVLLVFACNSSGDPAAHGGSVVSPAGSGAVTASPEASLAAASGGITVTELPACTRASTVVTDGGAPGCSSARTYLRCDVQTAVTEVCTSDDPKRCPDRAPADPSKPCELLCQANEYAVACGGPGPTILPIPEPPANCRALFSGPGGGMVWCCPCL